MQRLEQLRRDGDESEATAIALALGYTTQAQILDNRNDPAGPVTEQRSLAILRPIAEAPGASVAVRRAYVESLVRAGFEATSSTQFAAGIPLLQHAMQLAQDLGARNLADVDMAAYYAESGAWYATCLVSLGRDAEARRTGDEVFAVADQVLALRPTSSFRQSQRRGAERARPRRNVAHCAARRAGIRDPAAAGSA